MKSSRNPLLAFAVATGLLFGSMAAQAAPIQISIESQLIRIGWWETGHSSGLNACIARATFGDVAFIVGHDDNGWLALITSERWASIIDGRQYATSYTFDRKRQWTGQDEGVRTNLGPGLIVRSAKSEFIEDIARSSDLEIAFQNSIVAHISLRGTRAAINLVEVCNRQRSSRDAFAIQGDPFRQANPVASATSPAVPDHPASPETLSQLILNRVRCGMPFSVERLHKELQALNVLGHQFRSDDGNMCYAPASPLDLLDGDAAPIRYLCFADPNLMKESGGPQHATSPSELRFSVGFVDKGEAIEAIWQDGGSPLPDEFHDERDISKHLVTIGNPLFADAEWSCRSGALDPSRSSFGPTSIPYRFDDFPALSNFTGITQLPDFNGRDREYRNHRTRISEGIGSGPHFAHHYSMVTIGCGTQCSFAYVGDNNTGQVYNVPLGGEENSLLQFQFDIKSRLVVAQWGNYDAGCYRQYFEWTGRSLRLMDTTKVGEQEACHNDIPEH